jgi:hypothetical protein
LILNVCVYLVYTQSADKDRHGKHSEYNGCQKTKSYRIRFAESSVVFVLRSFFTHYAFPYLVISALYERSRTDIFTQWKKSGILYLLK